MTILFFARSFYPNIGGVEKHVLEVGRRLIQRGFKVIVITENYSASWSKSYHSLPLNDKIEGINIIRIDAGKNGKLKKIRVWFRLLRHLKVIKDADIVHCHDIFFWYLPFRFLFLTKPVYTTFHGYEGNSLPTRKAILMHKIAEKLSNGNICVGDYLSKWYGTKPNIVTYGAVDIFDSYKSNRKKKLRNVLYIGRLEDEAGIMIYLKSMYLLQEKGINLKLTVLGNGSQKDEAIKYSHKNKLVVDFKGFVVNVNNYFPKADIVFTSRYLGTLESFVFKKFVFSVYNNEIKKDCFELSPFKDFLSLAADEFDLSKFIEDYIKDPNFFEVKINKAYEWVISQTWDHLVTDYLKLWRLNR